MKYDFVQQTGVNKQEGRRVLFNLVMNMAYTAFDVQLFCNNFIVNFKGLLCQKISYFLQLYDVLNQNNKNVLIFYWQQ